MLQTYGYNSFFKTGLQWESVQKLLYIYIYIYIYLNLYLIHVEH